ncbi:hypothetical protein GIS00_26485 [Nakamurella sp. YIM 132087]|uniref:Helicase-associated domain-containing protein n=1 Tax=Nakamurella alba TaxID=2665158 RepID=A0A7K1FTJ1_9ACTN|nr:hypothetical protein [Nakamurella alba]
MWPFNRGRYTYASRSSHGTQMHKPDGPQAIPPVTRHHRIAVSRAPTGHQRGWSSAKAVRRNPRAIRPGRLASNQITRKMPGMTFQRDDVSWNARLSELVSFARRTGHLPTAHRQASASERQLIRWLYLQRQHASKDLMPVSRLRQLDRLLPSWRGQPLGPLVPARPGRNPQDEPSGI